MTFSELEYLKEEMNLLEDAAKILDYSYQLCSQIGVKEEYSFEEMDHFEALTSRFARTNDILIQKVFRAIDELELESSGTVRDRIQRAEKKSLIDSAEDFVEMRILRNDIAHEYLPSVVKDIFEKVLDFTPELLESIQRVRDYCEKFNEKR
jgi:uncharacterized protein YutE (UPF0331/DUF86 family)